MPDRDFHIAIVGGGIGGLALAVALTRYDISFTLYEAAPQFGTVGAGVGLGPNALRAMDAVVPGFQEMYDRISSGNVTPGKDHVMMDAMYIEEGFGERKGWKPVSYGAPCYNRTSAHRKDLLDILIAGVPPEKVQFRKRATGFRQHRGGPDGEEGVTISFEDGTESRVDAVIGADGVKGLSRAAVLGERWPELVPARYTGRYVYRSVVPMDAATAILGQDCLGNDIAGDARMFMGPRAIITIFPISKGTQCNLVCFILVGDQPWTHPEWTQTVSKEEMRKDLREAGIDHRLVQMLDVTTPRSVGPSTTTP
ncbi:hypothetical protein VTK73DRAFT_2101 [Phialemonium thermophilum]|uniref:FAD-binding domain-containing protein n=1 Tax=Phialemonium thermophilum TaxID=223376 RepID=A0ABR3VSM4_9PEZI